MVVTEPAVGRRERKKAQTRQALEDAAWQLFALHGFEGTTVEAITETVDVSQRTFFRYFPSKEAVLFGPWEDRLGRIAVVLEGRPRNEALSRSLKEGVLSLADDFEADRERHLLRNQWAKTSPSVAAYSREVIQAAWVEVVVDFVERRLDVNRRSDLRPRLIAGGAVAALDAAIELWLATDGTGDLPQMAGTAFDLLSSAFGAG